MKIRMIKYKTIINHPLSDTQSTQLPHHTAKIRTKSPIGQFMFYLAFCGGIIPITKNCRIYDLAFVKHADNQVLLHFDKNSGRS